MPSLVSGEILEAPFEEGQTVHKGDVLFRIDASSVENNIQQLQLNVQSAQLALDDLLETQSDNQKNRNVTAEDGGIITELYVEQGDAVTVGTVIADVLDRDHMKLEVPFHSADAALFRPHFGELELKQGSFSHVEALARRLSQKYGLVEEPLSKFQQTMRL